MGQAKRFSARKPRFGPLSVNPETARVREYQQSRVGFQAEQVRISTKYRTRLTKAKSHLHDSKGWSKLSSKEQVQKERELMNRNQREKEAELNAAAKE